FQRVAVIGGAGMIGRAIVEGLLARGLLPPDSIHVTARQHRSLDRLRGLGVRTGTDNAAAVAGADATILAVHPDQAVAVLRGCASSFRPGHLLISVVTGTAVENLRTAAGPNVNVVRAMPNIAAVIGASVTTITAESDVSEAQLAFANKVFEAVGTTIFLEEKHLNACTGLAGCGPAFAFKVIESLAEGGVKMGLPRDVSRKMAAWVLLGAARLVLTTGKHPAELKDDVSTPGGCTIDGIAKLEERGLPIALIAAVEASTQKAALLFPNHHSARG
ncbi:MAG: pyrroline-5-carboxylate reductase, partial [Deltaproteobacteria bacterium]|nr:pyrroline-5-carboxylate reductase [Deltaproteobacteria bacterium]